MSYLFAFMPLLTIGVVSFLIPNLTPRYTLFGVRVAEGFRQSIAARQAVAAFRLTILAGMCAAACIALFAARSAFAAVAPGFLATALSAAAWFWQYRRIKPFAVQSAMRISQVELSTETDRLPRAVWLAALPPLLLAFAALYLNANWNRIPAHFPVHWESSGASNRWADRTVRGVYGQLIFAALLNAWLLLLMLSIWHGVRRSKYRVTVFYSLVAVQLQLAVIFCAVALSPMWSSGPMWATATILISVAGLLLFMILLALRTNALPDDDGDGTPDSAWHAGVVYFNRDDPALAVPRRDGFGYTVNLANYQAWLLTLAPFAILAVAALWLL